LSYKTEKPTLGFVGFLMASQTKLQKNKLNTPQNQHSQFLTDGGWNSTFFLDPLGIITYQGRAVKLQGCKSDCGPQSIQVVDGNKDSHIIHGTGLFTKPFTEKTGQIWPNVGKYTIHGCYGIWNWGVI